MAAKQMIINIVKRRIVDKPDSPSIVSDMQKRSSKNQKRELLVEAFPRKLSCMLCKFLLRTRHSDGE
jgi:hypothetical protein